MPERCWPRICTSGRHPTFPSPKAEFLHQDLCVVEVISGVEWFMVAVPATTAGCCSSSGDKKDFDRDRRRDEVDVGSSLHIEVADSDASTLGGSRLPVPRHFRGRVSDFV
ncbi:uncharacterized protein LOC122051146 [Zingiber officinale]|uniref:uncharacterized protein LOC122051146 n=1 Tax=Zingiber officinale TaxID=94328 RepID=UPI001C4AB4F7|nr:uncharacterized protein LOC122051146 [Zingiber officinale]